MSDDDADGSLSREEGGGVGVVVAVGHHMAVVEVQMEGTLGISAIGGGVGWAESRPLPATVEGDHGDMGGVCEMGDGVRV